MAGDRAYRDTLHTLMAAHRTALAAARAQLAACERRRAEAERALAWERAAGRQPPSPAERDGADDLTELSHDLRTPLTVIVGYVELLQGRLDRMVASADMCLWLAQVRDAARRLEGTIDQLTEAPTAVRVPPTSAPEVPSLVGGAGPAVGRERLQIGPQPVRCRQPLRRAKHSAQGGGPPLAR